MLVSFVWQNLWSPRLKYRLASCQVAIAILVAIAMRTPSATAAIAVTLLLPPQNNSLGLMNNHGMNHYGGADIPPAQEPQFMKF